MLPSNFTFEFEELPLLISGDLEHGLINGSAEISYDRSGDYSLDAIFVDGHKVNHWTLDEQVEARRAGKYLPRYTSQPLKLEAGSPLEVLIRTRLETEWRERVQDKVNEAIDYDRECEAGNEADRRHDERKMARA